MDGSMGLSAPRAIMAVINGAVGSPGSNKVGDRSFDIGATAASPRLVNCQRIASKSGSYGPYRHPGCSQHKERRLHVTRYPILSCADSTPSVFSCIHMRGRGA